MVEEWRPVVGFEGAYDISSEGRVRNVRRQTILSERRNSEGYSRVALSLNGRYSHRVVHRLVAEAFLGSAPEGKPLVLHGPNGNADNSVDNLRWGSYSENMYDRRRDGTDYHANKTHCVNGHEYTEENTYINRDGHRSCNTCRRRYAEQSNQRRRNNG